MKRWIRVLLSGLSIVASSPDAVAQKAAVPDLSRATLEDLMNITITTATRNAERSADAPARVQVVSAAQIERRGYRSLADLLRDLPEIKVDFAGDPDYPFELTVQGVRGATASSCCSMAFASRRRRTSRSRSWPITRYTARVKSKSCMDPRRRLTGPTRFRHDHQHHQQGRVEAASLALSTSVGQFGLYNQRRHAARVWARTPASSWRASFSIGARLEPFLSRAIRRAASAADGRLSTIFGSMMASGVWNYKTQSLRTRCRPRSVPEGFRSRSSEPVACADHGALHAGQWRLQRQGL
jgi:hypothetical protein